MNLVWKGMIYTCISFSVFIPTLTITHFFFSGHIEPPDKFGLLFGLAFAAFFATWMLMNDLKEAAE